MHKVSRWTLLATLMVGLLGLVVARHVQSQDKVNDQLAGTLTVTNNTDEAFEQPIPSLDAVQLATFNEGDDLFSQEWQNPSSTASTTDGLGPIFNAVSCETCHAKDGRGEAFNAAGEQTTGFLIRLSVPGETSTGSPVPDPTYGGQFQSMSIQGVFDEGDVRVTYTDAPVTFADGRVITLRNPHYELVNLNYGALSPDVMMSPRVAQQMIGLGLLEAIPEEMMLAMADPNDLNGDGISGRPNYVWDYANSRVSIGRFGWKANQPILYQQSAGAFNGDIGILTNLFSSNDCTTLQFECVRLSTIGNASDATPITVSQNVPARPPHPNGGGEGRPHGNGQGHPQGGGGNGQGRSNNDATQTTANTLVSCGALDCFNAEMPEISEEDLAKIVLYSNSLSVPAQRNANDPQVQRGFELFLAARCNACHVETLQTGTSTAISALSNQVIHPYTDLLLHDMGAGLADNRPDFLATGTEWRTPPLWGIGLFETVNGHTNYLHDGRARNVLEAVLWHGGEAESSKNAILNMSQDDVNALIAFLQSL